MRMYGRTSKRIIVKANDKSAKVVIMLVKEYYELLSMLCYFLSLVTAYLNFTEAT